MEFLGIGPLELLFVIILALIIFGPNDMIKAGKTIGRVLRGIITSPNWRAIQETSKEIRNLPNRLMREAGIDDLQKELPKLDAIRKDLGVDEMQQDIHQIGRELSEWTTPPRKEISTGSSPSPEIDPPPSNPETESDSKQDPN